VQDTVEEVDAESLQNLPIGVDGSTYRWTDLHGEGIPGILTEQAGAWFYKRNLSPIPEKLPDGRELVKVRLAALETVASKPNVALAGGAEFMDLAGDGQPDVVVMEGPTPGLYEHDEAEGWQPFRPFTSRLNRNLHDPNLKFVDLDGDGHADLLISEDDAFVWHASLAEAGFGPARRVAQALDEEKGPRIVFADGTQSIYLADLSGDGLTDIARIRNGEVCYWPNLGYGRFGAKVTMDHAPLFDNPDQFDHKRLRLADIDGSGTTDLIYLHRDGVRLYFNQSGNGWSAPQQLKVFPRIDDVQSIIVSDLLGNGTACLVWSSPLPGDARRPMRYVNLMGAQKPHLLIKTINNLGAATSVQYAPSTKFYLQDRLAGKPWITRLPFPVHVVEKVTVTDHWRQTSFSSTYSYHHGYFDGEEREFRGFGRVEQVDVEDYGKTAKGNVQSPYITPDTTLYQPPVKTITWYHTGAFIDRQRILSQFAHEYFPRWFEDQRPDAQNVLGEFLENSLPEPDLPAQNLSGDEWRQALRACKGMVLRQEVYELDVDALANGEHRPVRLFSAACHNCHIRLLQAMAANRHAVFLVAESEATTYHYELDLKPTTLRPDPRVAHTLNLTYDDYGNVLQSVAVVYPRLDLFKNDTSLAAGLVTDTLNLIDAVQQETHLAYTETRYTDDFGSATADAKLARDNHRLRVPCEVLTYELTGIGPEDADDRASKNDPRDNRYFTLDELRRYKLSPVHQSDPKNELTPVSGLAYHELADTKTTPPPPRKRLVEHVRMTFFKDDAPTLDQALTFGQSGRLGLPHETFKLALTSDLLDAIFVDGAANKLDQTQWTAGTARKQLGDASISGYLSGQPLAKRFAEADEKRFTKIDTTGQYWIRSGIAGFAADAAQHFYLPERYTDPFGQVTTLEYDALDLYIRSSIDPLGNCTEVTRFDYRVLAPREVKDINDNLSEILFDTLGMPAAMAVKGKGDEADNLQGFDHTLLDPAFKTLANFFVGKDYDRDEALRLLGNATARYVYYFGEERPAGKPIAWATHPACACGILRERHLSQIDPGAKSPVQTGFEYSDGLGSVLVKKVQAEPAPGSTTLRWIASGKTILNNKGKPVKQYEPYFSPPDVGHRFEEPREEGVTPLIYYDAVGRSVRTEFPDGSHSRVEFSPWHVRTHDQNDTVLDSTWYAAHAGHPPCAPEKPLPVNVLTGKLLATPEQRAAWLAAQHANTPALTILDSLGREVLAVAHNRCPDTTGTWHDERHVTFTKLDAEGKPLWIRDARGNLVMQYLRPVPTTPPTSVSNTVAPSEFIPAYDVAGNLLFQDSMDAGDRWLLNDAAGKPMFAWDSRGHAFLTAYDALRRPLASYVKGADAQDPNREILFEKLVYGDTLSNGLTDAAKKALNLSGKLYQHCDTAGIVVSMAKNPTTGLDEAFDCKGNPLRSTRRLIKDYKATPDWAVAAPAPELETETFTTSTRYDALNRPIQVVPPYSDRLGSSEPIGINVIRPGYNDANLLERVEVWLGLTGEPDGLLDRGQTPPSGHGVRNIDYNANGQQTQIEYGNGAVTTYAYDPETFRLIHLLTARGNTSSSDCAPQISPRTCQDPPTRCPNLASFKCIVQDLSYTYDPIGNITHIQDDAQQAIYFSNQCIEPSSDYAYDALYRLIEGTGREHLGQVGGPPLPHSHDDSLRVGVPHPGDGTAMGRYIESYQYDAVGNILAMGHRGTNPQAGSWKRCCQYVLDSNRLLSTSNPFDRKSDDACADHYSATAIYTDQYRYDAHGSMLCMPHLPLMQWDFQDQLHATAQQVVAKGSPETTWYVYDAAGQRVRKLTELANDDMLANAAIKDERIYLGGFEIYRRHSGTDAGLERETLHIIDDKQRIALVETRNDIDDGSPKQLVRYQFGDHLGSASLEMDHEAQIISYEEYTPYGSTSYQAVGKNLTAAAKRYRYTGKELDEESGLNYHGARYYAVRLGRWTACDPAGISTGTNPYQYCSNSPITLIDLDGKQDHSYQIFGDKLRFDVGIATFEALGIATLENPAHYDYLDSTPKPADIEQQGGQKVSFLEKIVGGIVMDSLWPTTRIRAQRPPVPDTASSDAGFDKIIDKVDQQNAQRVANFGSAVRFFANAALCVESSLAGTVSGAKAAASASSAAKIAFRANRATLIRESEQFANFVMATLSKTERGPVATTVLDKITGQIFHGLNIGRKGAPPTASELAHLKETLHPLLKKYVEKQEKILAEALRNGTMTEKMAKAAQAGTHSEVVALNNAIRARIASGIGFSEGRLGEFMLRNRTLLDTARFRIPEPCFNCRPITRGVHILFDL